MTPEVRYAKSGSVHIAYSVFGDGPVDLVVSPGWVSNVAGVWLLPSQREFYSRLASFCRVLLFDKRGTGLSDRDVAVPSIEERVDDLRAVMDDAKFESASIFGVSEGGSLAMVFAASDPLRTQRLSLFGTFAKRVWSEDYPWAPTPEERQGYFDLIERSWGQQMDIAAIAPSVANDPERVRALGEYYRSAASPSAALALAKLNTHIDVRHVLPSIQAPTLVMHRTGDKDALVGQGRWIAEQIPNAKFVELAGDDHVPFYGNVDAVIGELQEFLTGSRPEPDADRILATVMFTDIVGSTDLASKLGDRRWIDTLERHDALIATAVDEHRGRLVKKTGDGALAVFDGPARATRCAQRIAKEAPSLGLEIRAGLHSGEIELRGDDVGGIAVHIAARVASEAGPSEVLVTRTVKDLTSGAGLNLTDRGEKTLAGVSEPWRLFAAT